MRRRAFPKVIWQWVVIVLYLVFTLLPILWTLSTSFKTTEEVYAVPPLLFPRVSLRNYLTVFQSRPFFQYTFNSLFVSVVVAAVCITVGALASYGFSCYTSKTLRNIFNIVIGSRMVPPVALITPFAIIFSRIGLIDTKLSMILVNLSFNLPFSIWIMKNYFDSIPKELDDAAQIDGCDNLDTFARIKLPIARSGITTAGIIAFLFTWNEFVFATLLSRTPVAKTLPIGLTDFFMDDYVLWNLLAAATIFVIIPAIIFVLFFQKHIVRGMTEGSIKG